MTRSERIVLFGALGMMLISAVVGAAAGYGTAAASGPAMRVHVQAGLFGCLTLAVLAVALRMAQGAGDPRATSGRWGTGLSSLVVAVVAAFVIARASGSAGAQVWAGAGGLAGLTAYIGWLAIVARRSGARWTVPSLAMTAALAVLIARAVIGAASAGAVAAGHGTEAVNLVSSYSALALPFVLLAATSVIEWSSSPDTGAAQQRSTAGLVQVGALILAAAAVTAGVLGHDLTLVEANVPLELGGIAVFLVRVGPGLLTTGSARSGRTWLVTATVALAVDIGLFAHVVFEIGARRYVYAGSVPRWLVFSVDHTTFVAVGTSAVFGAVAVMAAGRADLWPRADAAACTGLVLGLSGSAVGIGAGSSALESASATLLGLSVLAATVVAGTRVVGLSRRVLA